MASQRLVLERSNSIAKRLCEELGLILWDVEFKKEGAQYVLRLLIDREGGVRIEDCEALSRAIDPILDEEDYIDESYMLEVSSPGIFRTLRLPWHFKWALDLRVELKLFAKQDGAKQFVGLLKEWSDKSMSIETAEGQRTFENGQVASVHLSPEL